MSSICSACVCKSNACIEPNYNNNNNNKHHHHHEPAKRQTTAANNRRARIRDQESEKKKHALDTQTPCTQGQNTVLLFPFLPSFLPSTGHLQAPNTCIQTKSASSSLDSFSAFFFSHRLHCIPSPLSFVVAPLLSSFLPDSFLRLAHPHPHPPSIKSSPEQEFSLFSSLLQMADTPKSPGRRLLRKSALQASPFGATIKSFHSSAATNKGSSSSSSPPRSQTQSQSQSQPQAQEQHGLPNPFNDSPSPAGSQAALVLPDSPQDHSPSSRKSARLSGLYRQNGTLSSGNSPTQRTPTRPRLMPPNTPKKTKIKTGVWGHIVGLKKQDESEYYRYPIDKSYCSFGRGDTNDIRVQIDAVSDLHCKLIRRDDGEVSLRIMSTMGVFR